MTGTLPSERLKMTHAKVRQVCMLRANLTAKWFGGGR